MIDCITIVENILSAYDALCRLLLLHSFFSLKKPLLSRYNSFAIEHQGAFRVRGSRLNVGQAEAVRGKFHVFYFVVIISMPFTIQEQLKLLT